VPITGLFSCRSSGAMLSRCPAHSERCRSGRTGRSRKPLSLLRGTEGSNPSLSAGYQIAQHQPIARSSGTQFAPNDCSKCEESRRWVYAVATTLNDGAGSPTIAASYQPIAAVHTGNGRKPGRQVLVARRKHGVLRSAWMLSLRTGFERSGRHVTRIPLLRASNQKFG
jgi:hypothetical protein